MKLIKPSFCFARREGGLQNVFTEKSCVSS